MKQAFVVTSSINIFDYDVINECSMLTGTKWDKSSQYKKSIAIMFIDLKKISFYSNMS